MITEHRKAAWDYAGLIIKKLAFWRKEPPIAAPETFAEFVETRAKYIAQMTLYGYLKTRAGTRFPSLFEDELFGRSLEIAKWHVYLACLSDLMVYSGGLAVARGFPAAEMSAMTDTLARGILARDGDELAKLEDGEKPQGAIHTRLALTDWAAVEDGEGPFEGSQNALVEWAPVAPQLKEFDTEIVINSMRFKWKHVRDELRQRLDAEKLSAAWTVAAPGGARPADHDGHARSA